MASHRSPVLLSGSQLTGNLTIGNYIGAMRHWARLQEQYDCLFMLADLHALTVRNDPDQLRRRSRQFAALYLACGIDPDRATVFLQSHVPQHTQLAWVLACAAPFGQLGRMTQFKDKAKKHPDNINAGLFTYPVLMAADILLYDTNLVPVGDDQKQHLELTRDLAQIFNRTYGQVLKIPEPYIPAAGARVMSLQDLAAKMSKTDPKPANYIALLDEPDAIRRKIRRAVTDPGTEVVASPDKPAISNLLMIYTAISGETLEQIQLRCAGKGYGQFKEDLAERLVRFLQPIREGYEALIQDSRRLDEILLRGARQAGERASHVLARVYDRMGLALPRHDAASLGNVVRCGRR